MAHSIFDLKIFLMRKKIVAGNWKMNKTLSEAMEIVSGLRKHSAGFPPQTEVVLAPPSLFLGAMKMAGEPWLQLAAQNCHHEDAGAFTGEISAAMLAQMQIPFCIVGHSERRQFFFETDEWLRQKADSCLRNNVQPIFCCGETLDQRNAELHFETVQRQLEIALFHLDDKRMMNVVIAYEPVWAIGTGQTAGTDQAQEMHAFIRTRLKSKFGNNVSDNVRILYGGSMKPGNAAELMACPDVDGGLVGGASLNVADFVSIIKAAAQ